MPAITLVNQVPASNAPSAEFRLSQARNPIVRIGVHSGAQASIPLQKGAPTYAVKAMTNMGDFTLTSNTIQFTAACATVLAQVLVEDGYFDFQLVQLPGTRPQTIVCENTWRAPVQFTFQVPGSPIQIVNVVDEGNSAEVSTAQQWQCWAIVNGITTQAVTIDNPNAVITLVANDDADSYSLVVTGSTSAQATAPQAATKENASAPARQEEASAGAAVIPVAPAA